MSVHANDTRMTVRLAAAAAAAALALQMALAPAATAAGLADGKFMVGDQAPDFTLADTKGRPTSLAAATAKGPVLLAFWAMRCGTCLSEIPHLERLHAQYAAKGVTLLAVNTDGVDAPTLAATLRDLKLAPTYTILLDPEFAVSDAYTNFVVPLTLVVDRTGVVRYTHTGFDEGTEREYEKALLAALAP